MHILISSSECIAVTEGNPGTTETGDPARLPAQVVGDGDLESEEVCSEENNICTGLTKAAKAGQNLL